MYVYELYNFDFDDSVSIKILHNKKFNKEEFENIVNTCLQKYMFLKKEYELKLNDYLQDKIKLTDEEANYYLDITNNFNKMKNIIDILKKDYGFYYLENSLYTFIFDKFNAEKGTEHYNKIE